MKLKHTTIKRKAGTAGTKGFKMVASDVTLGPGLRLSFTTKAQGGTGKKAGKHDFCVQIGVEDYADILKAMCEVDREAGLLAAASVLVPHLTEIKDERDKIRKEKAAEDAKQYRPLKNLVTTSSAPDE